MLPGGVNVFEDNNVRQHGNMYYEHVVLALNILSCNGDMISFSYNIVLHNRYTRGGC